MRPSAGFTRINTCDTTIANYAIPRGSEFFFAPTIQHTDPTVFPDPQVFRPERWLDSAHVSDVQNASYFPFSSGARAHTRAFGSVPTKPPDLLMS